MKVVCVIQARMGSTRLPGKVMMDLDGLPVLNWVFGACSMAANVDQTVIATTTCQQDDVIALWCFDQGVPCYRGPEEDVLSRFMYVMRETDGDAFVRITADEPLMDTSVVEKVVGVFLQQGYDYCSNVHPRTYPDGLDVEVFTAQALILANDQAKRPIDRECVTSWMVRHPEHISQGAVLNHLDGMKGERWVLDTKEDYDFCVEIAKRLDFRNVTQASVLKILEENPFLRKINQKWGINERFFEALDQEPLDAKKELEGFLVAGSNREIVDTIDKLIELRIEEHARNNSGAFR